MRSKDRILAKAGSSTFSRLALPSGNHGPDFGPFNNSWPDLEPCILDNDRQLPILSENVIYIVKRKKNLESHPLKSIEIIQSIK